MNASSFSALFLVALASACSCRHLAGHAPGRHVAAHRGGGAGAFAATHHLDAHTKAADYTVARVRGVVDLLISAAAGLTLGGGLQALHDLARFFDAGGLAWRGLHRAGGGGVVAGGLPLAIYRRFGLEARFGFNPHAGPVRRRHREGRACLAAVIGLPLIAFVLWLMGAIAMGAWWFLYGPLAGVQPAGDAGP